MEARADWVSPEARRDVGTDTQGLAPANCSLREGPGNRGRWPRSLGCPRTLGEDEGPVWKAHHEHSRVKTRAPH